MSYSQFSVNLALYKLYPCVFEPPHPPGTRSLCYHAVLGLEQQQPAAAVQRGRKSRAREGESHGAWPTMAAAWWWPSLPAWLGSEAVWFVALNAVVAAVAILSSRARPSLAATPRRGGGGVTRRASSAVLQSLRSFSIFSFPSACMSFLQPDAAAAAYQETEELVRVRSPTNKPLPSPRALVLAPPPPVPAAGEEDVDDNDEEYEDEDPNAMSMDEAYALVLASRQRPEREQEEAARLSVVDAKAEEFIRRFKEDQRQQRLNSIFNYTQMLKQRGLAGGRRPPDARPDQL
ncbi:uncharacterized protein LOC120677735 [Panicum virgatum]|uniref:Uncharacterized protein n=1 Tax=Panicum virgatum TaxID=38727 RepID=A0A8T0W791_PANVG|nr:uncharacterized protein LOC120677735 [Panicum virgatum]KAG2643058.1 hypothetical protein PVAP13_2KG327667 [Panicum virgatum]